MVKRSVSDRRERRLGGCWLGAERHLRNGRFDKRKFTAPQDIRDYGEMCGLNDETDESDKSLIYPWNVKIGVSEWNRK
ncbi:unnamed protein product [Ranitomeya imitator]|uniref:Uncharacterized protein n=1 Tax=Ranitomeya imitator TaxID=111125 RepID=A0ABN9LWJ2_9NEOB|nr:unnamed protein product [Ranitomeya imitator]